MPPESTNQVVNVEPEIEASGSNQSQLTEQATTTSDTPKRIFSRKRNYRRNQSTSSSSSDDGINHMASFVAVLTAPNKLEDDHSLDDEESIESYNFDGNYSSVSSSSSSTENDNSENDEKDADELQNLTDRIAMKQLSS